MPDETDSKSKISDSNNQKKDILDIMKELQPVAFLISMCLVIAAFYVNPVNGVSRINLIYILMASLFFFFAYVGLFYYKKTDFSLFLYFGECSLIGGTWFIYNAFSGIFDIIDKEAYPSNAFYLTIFMISFFLIVPMYLSGKVKKGKIYNFSKVLFHLSLILFFSYILSYFCIYPLYYVLKLQGLYIYILVFVGVILRMLLMITSSLCFVLMMLLYEWETIIPWILNLTTKLKSTGTFGVNITESLRIIVKSLGKIIYLMISFCLIIIGSWLIIGN